MTVGQKLFFRRYRQRPTGRLWGPGVRCDFSLVVSMTFDRLRPLRAEMGL